MLTSITMVDTGPSPARVSAEMASKEDEIDGRYIFSVGLTVNSRVSSVVKADLIFAEMCWIGV